MRFVLLEILLKNNDNVWIDLSNLGKDIKQGSVIRSRLI